jgi:hypothetical protein
MDSSQSNFVKKSLSSSISANSDILIRTSIYIAPKMNLNRRSNSMDVTLRHCRLKTRCFQKCLINIFCITLSTLN